MKIIKEGNPNHPIVFECSNCHCVFEADEHEYDIHEYAFNKYAEAKCPCCGFTVIEYIN